MTDGDDDTAPEADVAPEATEIAPPRPVPGALFQYILVTADDPVLATDEVAEQLPIGERATLKRLQSLAADDYIEAKKAGGKVYVWWVEHLAKDRLERVLGLDDYGGSARIPSHKLNAGGKPWGMIYGINKNR